MIRKIICPTDFSATAANAAAYAAKLAQLLSAELLLVNIQTDADPYVISVAESRLQQMSDEINRMFHISTDYEHDVSEMPIGEALSGLDSGNTMIVMGTNGTDNFHQLLYGTNTYSVVQRLKCPVLVVPENASYGSIVKVVFAWDYTEANARAFFQLQELMQPIEPRFVFLHVSRHHTLSSHEVFEVNRKKILALPGFDQEHTVVYFKQIFSTEITETLNDYMIESGANLLVVTSADQKKTLQLFREHVVKTLSQRAQYPLLVLHV